MMYAHKSILASGRERRSCRVHSNTAGGRRRSVEKKTDTELTSCSRKLASTASTCVQRPTKKKKKRHVRVDGAKVTLDAANLFFKDLVPKSRLEFALPERRGGNTHGFLATTEKDLTGKRGVR
jgi:hypothetical protein